MKMLTYHDGLIAIFAAGFNLRIMKNIAVLAFVMLLFYGCEDKKAEEKMLLDTIIKVHDKVMDGDEQLMKNKTQLSILLKRNDLASKDTALMLSVKLNSAENAMDSWMHKFDPGRAWKTHAEAMSYMSAQKKRIIAIDAQINDAITKSDKYLLKVKPR